MRPSAPAPLALGACGPEMHGCNAFGANKLRLHKQAFARHGRPLMRPLHAGVIELANDAKTFGISPGVSAHIAVLHVETQNI